MRRCGTIIPCSEWPARDKALWDVGVRPTTILDGSGVAARWRARTVSHTSLPTAAGWAGSGRRNQLDPGLPPAARVNRYRLRSYIGTLQSTNKPATVFGRVVGLERALAVIAPEFDRGLLRVAIKKLPRASDPARKRARLQESAALVDLGITLMQRAEHATSTMNARWNAAQFRDALQVALLALRPFRIKNLAEMELGSNLVHRGEVWWLVYAPEATKNRRLLEVPFPEALLPWLAKYLDHYRPLLAGNRYRGARVWVSMHYRALWRGTIYQKIMWLTEKAFGRGLSPHLFRDCLATSTGDP